MTGLLSWIVLGLIAGVISKMIIPGSDLHGWVLTIILGIVGSAVGGWIGSELGFGSVSGFDLRSLAIAVGGSVLVLFLYRRFAHRMN